MTFLPDTGLPDSEIFPEPDIGYRIPDSGSDILCFHLHQADSGISFTRYGVDNKKVFHKSEGKMHKKVKMTFQRAKNLVHMKQHHGVSFYKKNIFHILIYIADMAD